MFNEKFWLAIAFFSFLAAIIKYAWPHIAKGLDNKSKQIAEEILAAKEMKEKAAELLKKAEKQYHDAQHYAEKLIKDAEVESARFAKESQEILQNELNKKTAAALERIKLEEESAIRDIKAKIVAGAIKTVTENAQNLSADQHGKLAKQSISDLEKIIS